MNGFIAPSAPRDRRIISVRWPALWCLAFFIFGFVAGRLW